MISEWIKQLSKYPPSEVYAGMPQGKQEKQAILLCETLYKLNCGDKPNVLAELRDAFRELVITSKMNTNDCVKPTYRAKVLETFLLKAQTAVNAMDAMFKQHQALNLYYKTWRLSYQDIKKATDEYSIQFRKARD
ncbi:MAG: hypothetical protein [Caudoviricetes sp.]|nr:MAG: hypothetical protein [Caudoviricetes sp.]